MALRCLLIRLEAPLMSFGAPAVDHRRTVQPWPASSMLVGLFGNALGWGRSRADAERLDRLQERLRWAARIDRPGTPMQDFQTVKLDKDDEGWTTRGRPEGRKGGPDTYDSPHIRLRDFRADASVAIAVALAPAEESPNVDQIGQALSWPARPLFIGRKACVPSERLSLGCISADGLFKALASVPVASGAVDMPSLYCNDAALPEGAKTVPHNASDERRFVLDMHGGQQRVHQIIAMPASSTTEDPTGAAP